MKRVIFQPDGGVSLVEAAPGRRRVLVGPEGTGCCCGGRAYRAVECCDGLPFVWVVLDGTDCGPGDVIRFGPMPSLCYVITEESAPTSLLDLQGIPWRVLLQSECVATSCADGQGREVCPPCPTDCCIQRDLPLCNSAATDVQCCVLGSAYSIRVRTSRVQTQTRNGGAWPGGAVIDPNTGAVICADGCFITSDEHTLSEELYTDTTSIVYGVGDCRPDGAVDSFTRTINEYREGLFIDLPLDQGGNTIQVDTYELAQAIRTAGNCTPRLINPRVVVQVDETSVENGGGAFHVAYPAWPFWENVLLPDGSFAQEYCDFSAVDEVREVADPTFIEGNPVRTRTTRTLTGSRDCLRGRQERRTRIEQYECTVPEQDGRAFSPGIRWNDVTIVEVFEWEVEVISRDRCEVTQCFDRGGDPPSPLPLAPASEGRFFRRAVPGRSQTSSGGGCGGCGQKKTGETA